MISQAVQYKVEELQRLEREAREQRGLLEKRIQEVEAAQAAAIEVENRLQEAESLLGRGYDELGRMLGEGV